MPLSSLAIMPTRKIEDDSIVAHFSNGLLMHFSKGATVIQGYEEPEGVFLIKEGFIKAYSISQDGQQNLLLIHEVGEFIPLPWALDGEHTTGLFYEAMSDVKVLRVSKNKLRTALGYNAWLSREILSQTVNIITFYTQRIQTLEYRSARERVIAEVIYLAKRFGKSQGNEVLINAPINHQDIADSINITRETAGRTLGLLFKEGLLRQRNHLFTVIDMHKLQTALG